MKEGIKKLLKNPWIVGIGTTVLSVFLLKIIDKIANTTILISIWNFIKSLFITILNFFCQKYESPLWFLFLLFISGALILLGVFYISSLFQKENKTPNTTPPFLNYTSDNFGRILYKWSYYKDYDNKYGITNLTAYCPKDNCIIYENTCPICERIYYDIKDNSELEILIRHRVENNMYIS